MYFKHTLYQPQENQDKDNANWTALQFAIAIASGQRSVLITIPNGPVLKTGSQTLTINKPQFCKYCEDAVAVQAMSGPVTYTATVLVSNGASSKTFPSTAIDSTDNTITITFNPTTTGTLTGVIVTVGGITIRSQILEG